MYLLLQSSLWRQLQGWHVRWWKWIWHPRSRWRLDCSATVGSLSEWRIPHTDTPLASTCKTTLHSGLQGLFLAYEKNKHQTSQVPLIFRFCLPKKTLDSRTCGGTGALTFQQTSPTETPEKDKDNPQFSISCHLSPGYCVIFYRSAIKPTI